MTYDEYVGIIMDSDIEDWEYEDTHQSYLYKKDISVMMKAKYTEEDSNFDEDWVKRYHNENAYVHIIELLYNGCRIKDFNTAKVDSGNMYIPYPSHEGLNITKQQYKIGKIVNIPLCNNAADRFDSYLSKAGITVK